MHGYMGHYPGHLKSHTVPHRPRPAPLQEHGLTDREREVVELVVSGFSYAQIAREIFVAHSTVGYHLSNIYAKCGVHTRHELTALVRSAVPALRV